MTLRPPRIRPVSRAPYGLTRYEQILWQSCDPRSALAKQARKRKGRAIAFFAAEEAVPEPIDDEATLPNRAD